MRGVARVVIIGGGPGGYEAALVSAQLGAEVSLVDSDGIGGSAVLTDCVPSKALIAVADVMDEVGDSRALGVRFEGETTVDLGVVNRRVLDLAGHDPAPLASEGQGCAKDGQVVGLSAARGEHQLGFGPAQAAPDLPGCLPENLLCRKAGGVEGGRIPIAGVHRLRHQAGDLGVGSGRGAVVQINHRSS